LRTPGTPRDNLLPRVSSEFRAVVTMGSGTAEKALSSSRGMQEAVLQDRHEGSGAQQRDGELQSSTESSPEGIADLHRVTLAIRIICQVPGPTTPSGVGPFPRWKATHTGHRWPDRRSRQPRPSRHDTPGWGLFAVGGLLALVLLALYVRVTPASTATSASNRT
jgi:hypothetical protein